MLTQAIEEYLVWMISTGYRSNTWMRTEKILGNFNCFVQRQKIPWPAMFTHFVLSSFENEHKKAHTGECIRGLWRYLYQQGKINEPLKKKKPLPDIYEEYLRYYGDRVLPDSVQSARWTLTALNKYLKENALTIAGIKIGDLDTFLALFTASFTPEVRRDKRYHLRGFLGYLYERKIIKKEIAPLLTGPPLFAQAKPPKFLRPHEVHRLFERSKPTTTRQIRTYAMLYLAYTLGLRPKEISLLSLDDISFSKKEVRIGNRKNTLPMTLPLPEDTIKAIAAYIVGVRPKSDYRTLFLSLRAPYAPLCRANVVQTITRCMRRAQVPGSSYWLRHTYAKNLLEQGASVFEIKEMLGHECLQSTENYLHVHITQMREVLLDETL